MSAAKPSVAPYFGPPVDATPAADDTSLSSLLGGIVNDLQDLLEDHLHLMKLEIEEDFQKSKDAMVPMAIGDSLLVAAFILIMAMMIGWLNWLMPSIPWFGWAGIVALVTAAFGGMFLLIARRKWRLVNPIPERTLRTVKKTIQSINDQVNTDKP